MTENYKNKHIFKKVVVITSDGCWRIQGYQGYPNKLVLVTCRWCPGVMKCFCTSCALYCWEGCTYPTSQTPSADMLTYPSTAVPYGGQNRFLLNTTLQERLSLVTSENLVLRRFSDKSKRCFSGN